MRPEEKLEQQPIQPVSAGQETVRDQDKIMIVLSYFGILALIPLLTVNDSEYVKWHAKNGLVLGLGGGIALVILGAILSVIPVIGGLLALCAWLAWLVLHVLGIVKGLKGIRWRIPVVTDVAEKL